MRDLASAVESYVVHCFSHCTPPRVDELARALDTHPSVLSRTFSAQTGRRLSAVLKERQIEEAKRLLRGTNCNMHSVARRAGFGTSNTLFRIFRTRVGVTPNRYRRQTEFQPDARHSQDLIL